MEKVLQKISIKENSAMQSFLQSTAWKMVPPQPYGLFHLSFFIIGLAVSVAAAYLLRNTNEKQNRAVFLFAGTFLLLCEVYKQLFYTYVIGSGSYQWWIFPFQLCSVPMYLCFVVAFCKNEKVNQYLYDFMVSFNLLGGFIAFLEPSGLIHDYWTLTLHAFIWHMSLVFIGLYIGFSKRGAKRLSDYKNTVVTFLVLCAVAFSINLLLRGVSAGSVNMFYVGPSISPIIVFKDIAKNFGWYVNTPIYMACLCLGAYFFFWLFAWAGKKLQSAKQKTANTDKITV